MVYSRSPQRRPDLQRPKEFGQIRKVTSAFFKTDSQYNQRKQSKRFRKKTGQDATISQLRHYFRMCKCYLIRDCINVILTASVYNSSICPI